MAFRVIDDEEIHTTTQNKPSRSIGNIVKETSRPFVRQLVNLGSLALGTPGDLLRTADTFLVNPIYNAATKFITGEAPPEYEEILPSSAQIKQSVQSLNPEYLATRNDVEELGDAIVEDFASLYAGRQLFKGKIPFANTLSKAQQIIRPLGIAIGSNLAETVVKDFTNNDSAAGWAKFGTALFLSMLDKQKAGQYVSQAYKKAEGLLPVDARQDASKLVAKISAIQRRASMGSLAPSEKFIVDEIDEILKRGQYVPGTGQATMNVSTITNIKRSLSEKLDKFVYENPKKLAEGRARKLGSGVVKNINEFLDEYGKTNPEWLETYREAEQGFSTLATSNKVGNYIKNNLKSSVLTTGLLKVLGVPIGAKTAAIGAVAYPSLQITYRIAASPLLRKYYGKIVKAAVEENSLLLNREINNLDKELQKPPSSGKFRVID